MEVVVPSIQRTFDVRTINTLNSAGLRPNVVTTPGERLTYIMALNSATLVVGCSAKGIALTRQWIMETTKATKIVMVDDDLSFHTRRTDDPTKFVPSTPKDVAKLFAKFDKLLDKYAHVSMIGRQGGNRVLADQQCARPWHVFGFNVPMVRAAGAKFEKGLLQDDFDITLQLLKKGLPNYIISDWAVNQHHGHGAPGGAATYRTVEHHNASVLRLQARHAPFVRVHEKAYVGDPWLGKRLETVIAWKQAYKWGLENATS